MNDLPDGIILWQYLMALKATAEVTLPTRFSLLSKISSDRTLPATVLQKYNNLYSSGQSIIQHYIRQSLQSYPILSISLQIYESLSTPSGSPEHCVLCRELIPASSPLQGTCPGGHSFRTLRSPTQTNLERCSITLLTLSTVYVLSCRVCGRKLIDHGTVFQMDEEWWRGVFPDSDKDDLVTQFPTVERCVYCGGEWYHKY